jgi:hypothetical protein
MFAIALPFQLLAFASSRSLLAAQFAPLNLFNHRS